MVISLLTATALTRNPNHMTIAGLVHVSCWIAQFLGHGLAEGRAPALLDNLVGGRFNHIICYILFIYNDFVAFFIAIVLAPFFVHLEVLFFFGYRPEMQKRIANEIGKEILKFRKAEGDKKRAAEKNQ
jgi:2-hydroxy fatty acid dioxygenase